MKGKLGVTSPSECYPKSAPRPRSIFGGPLSILRAAIQHEGLDPNPHVVIDGFLVDGWLVRVADCEFRLTIEDVTRDTIGPSPWARTGDDKPCLPIGDSFPSPFLCDPDPDDTIYQIAANFHLPESTNQER